MSLVVVIKDKDRVIMGADKQASTGATKDHAATKVWEVRDLPDAIMGGVGSMRVNQIIQYSDIIDKNDLMYGVTTEFIIKSLVPTLLATLESNGICCTIQDDDLPAKAKVIPNTFVFAYEDRAWVIWSDLSVIEIDNYFAIGSGSEVANGALYATPTLNPFERIVTSIEAAAEVTLFVDNGIDLIATDYYKEDDALINKALKLEPEPVQKKKTATKKKPTNK